MEDQEKRDGVRPPAAWPTRGLIDFDNLHIPNASDPDAPMVLRGITLRLEPGTHVGLVGPTGVGKTTLALSLFRNIEPTAGRILIDGIDISTVRLTDLRERLNLVVQDGTLSSGTLRDALDYTHERRVFAAVGES